MAETTNPLKTKLAAGEAVLGTMVTMASPALAQLLAAVEFDWLLFDMEHGPMSAESVHAMIAATAAGDAVPLVRMPATEPWLAKPALDAGALGLFFPLVESAEEAAEAVAACRYPPAGRRGFGPFYAPARWRLSMGDYAAGADDAVLTVVMIETATAVARADEILATPGINVAFVAPYDLSQSLGCPGDFEDDRFKEVLAAAEAAVGRLSAVLGGLAASAEAGRHMLERGYRFLMLGFDALVIDRACRGLLQAVRD